MTPGSFSFRHRTYLGATESSLLGSTRQRHAGRVYSFFNSTTVCEGGGRVKVSFTLPYHCKFGQHLCIVGSQDEVGEWDVKRGAAMEWTDGDIWRADVELRGRERERVEVEYKYVVRSRDGRPVHWKPGDNFSLSITLPDEEALLPEQVAVEDAWDGSMHAIKVTIPPTLPKGSPAAQPTATSSSPADLPMYTPTLPSSPKASVSAVAKQVTDSSASLAAEASSSLHSLDEAAQELAVVGQAADRAMKALEVAISDSIELLDSLDDPTNAEVQFYLKQVVSLDGAHHVEALAADRAVAAAARRAVTMMRALKAASPDQEVNLLESGQLSDIDDFAL